MLTGRVFDREKHRDDEWRFGRADLPLPVYGLVNQLLDRMIVADPWKRPQGGPQVADAVRGVLRVEASQGHALGREVPQLCTFCASGIYQRVSDPFEGKQPDNSPAEIFGFRPTGEQQWLILVCPTCANVQVFRPGLAPKSIRRWQYPAIGAA